MAFLSVNDQVDSAPPKHKVAPEPVAVAEPIATEAKPKSVYTEQRRKNRADRRVARAQLRAEGIANPTRGQVAAQVAQNHARDKAVTAGKLPIPENDVQRILRLRIASCELTVKGAAELMRVPVSVLKSALAGAPLQPPYLDLLMRAQTNLPQPTAGIGRDSYVRTVDDPKDAKAYVKALQDEGLLDEDGYVEEADDGLVWSPYMGGTPYHRIGPLEPEEWNGDDESLEGEESRLLRQATGRGGTAW